MLIRIMRTTTITVKIIAIISIIIVISVILTRRMKLTIDT